MTHRVRNICFTLNNYDEKDIELLDNLPCKYMIYGKEIAPTTGTPHLQGYIQFAEKKSFNKLCKLFRWNIRQANGSFEDNYIYCSKSKDFVVRGEPKTPGKRNDLKIIMDSVKQGKSMRTIIEKDCSNLQGIRMAEKVISYYENKRNWFTYVYWIYGSAGCGKTRFAHKILGKECHVQGSTKFWNGYDAHENVLLDDYRKEWFSLDYLLRLLDRYPMTVDTKGGYRQFVPKIIIITSDKSPMDLWIGNDLDQVMRRITMCIDFSKKIFSPRVRV